MSAPIRVLFLRLEGPLQSWGDDSRWSVRRTRPEPTKSGVVGVVAAALGLGRDLASEAEIARLGRELRLGVREDRPGHVLRDYHTVVGGVLSAEGKIKINAATKEPETVVSERYYLADACFLAALSGPRELLDQILSAVQNPVWPPFLGRKSCPPSAPLWPVRHDHPSTGDHSSLREALVSVPPLHRLGEERTRYRAVWELEPGHTAPPEGIRLARHDVPLSFRRRQFGPRTVEETLVTLGGA